MPDPHPLHLPSSAEVARTLLAGQGTASLSHPLQDTEGSPVLHASRLDGTVVLALPHGGRVGRTDQPAPTQRTVAVSVRAQAALPDLTLPRAHLDVLGWSAPVADGGRRNSLRALSRAWPVPPVDLLGAYHLIEVEVAEAELHWVGGCVVLDGAAVRGAAPDPLWQKEDELLEGVRERFADRLLALAHRLGGLDSPAGPHVRLDRATEVRPIAVDRYGLTTRCLDPTGSAPLLRFPFGRPLDDPETAWPAIASELTSHADNLATCPARSRPAGHRGRPVTGSTTGQDPPEPGQP